MQNVLNQSQQVRIAVDDLPQKPLTINPASLLELKTGVVRLETKIDNLKSDVDGLSTRHQTDIESVRTQIREQKESKLSKFGSWVIPVLLISRRDRVIFTDWGRWSWLAMDFFMGDQFAFGTRELMDSYTRSFLDVARSQAGQFFRHSKGWLGHECIALSTFYDGVAVEPLLPDLKVPGTTLNTPILSNSELYQALMRQIGGQPRHDVDVRLLEALGMDQKSERKS